MPKLSRPKRSRKMAVWLRDGFRCGYCGRPVEAPAPEVPKFLWASVDHKKPRSKGGSNKPDNLVTSCGPCNKRKADKDYAAFVASGKAKLSNNGGFWSSARLAIAMAREARRPEGSGASALPSAGAKHIAQGDA